VKGDCRGDGCKILPSSPPLHEKSCSQEPALGLGADLNQRRKEMEYASVRAARRLLDDDASSVAKYEVQNGTVKRDSLFACGGNESLGCFIDILLVKRSHGAVLVESGPSLSVSLEFGVQSGSKSVFTSALLSSAFYQPPQCQYTKWRLSHSSQTLEFLKVHRQAYYRAQAAPSGPCGSSSSKCWIYT